MWTAFLTLTLLSTALTITAAASSSSLLSRQTVVTDLPDQWAVLGCFEDDPSARSLNGASFVNATGMTVEACVEFCNSQSFVYAGLEFGQECYCDDVFENTADSVDSGECTQVCVGNPAQFCGAANRLGVYTSGIAAVFPTEVPSVGDWVALGCFSDSVSARTLQMSINAGSVTVESCTSACFSRGFTLAGVEFGRECWCGSQILNGGAFSGNSNGISGDPPVRQTAGGPFCDMACAGNSNELCGGSNRMNLYNYTGPTTGVTLPSLGNFLLLGCFRDQGTGSERTLRSQVFPNGGVTVDTCTTTCTSQGFSVAGVEDGTLCFCDTELVSGSSSTPISNSNCNTQCTANPLEICGGQNALNIYQFQNVNGVLAAFEPLSSASNTLVALINSVTSSNVQTVGPQIAPGIQALASTINTADSTASGAVNGGSHPLTGTFASEAANSLETAASGIDKVFSSLGAQSGILAPSFSTPILSGIQTLMNSGVALARSCAFDIIPSLSSEALSFQTDFERTSASAASAY